jgi:hypothetical protein
MDKEIVVCCKCVYFENLKEDAPKCNLCNYYVLSNETCNYAKKKKELIS